MRVRRRRRRTGIVVAASVLIAGSGWLLFRPGSTPIVAACTVKVGQLVYTLDPDQGGNATTIAAEAYRLGLPAHAVSVGLAAALQESKLRNLSYGDRDSLGLFQQRPSQGWGTPAQLLRPSYAASAFFRGLSKVDGWQSLPIYQAAQLVQRSADPAAYASWDTESRTLARGLTGETPASYSCGYPQIPKSIATTQHALSTDAATALGAGAFGPNPSVAYGWLVASWLISRAPTYAVTTVSFAGWTWTPGGKGWQRDAHAHPAGVSYLFRPST